jgi:uncharacterized phage-like protein YoqJ
MNTGHYEKACCVTGHRDIPAEKMEYVKSELRKEVLQAVEDGYTYFISGFAKGTDLIFASIVADLMAEYPKLMLEAAIPYRKRMNTPDPEFHRLIGKCKTIGVHSEEYNPASFMIRNRFMVSHSQRIIAVYDGRGKGGTVFTMKEAHSQNREVCVIRI